MTCANESSHHRYFKLQVLEDTLLTTAFRGQDQLKFTMITYCVTLIKIILLIMILPPSARSVIGNSDFLVKDVKFKFSIIYIQLIVLFLLT